MPEASDIEAIRAATFCLINHERAAHGVRPLIFNAKLQRAAQGHSASMVSEDYFGHYGPNGATPSDRIRAAGYVYSEDLGYEIGENIAWGTLHLATPREIVKSWMQSAGHRENILDRRYRETGIGVAPEVPSSLAERQAGGIYTQDFGVLIAP